MWTEKLVEALFLVNFHWKLSKYCLSTSQVLLAGRGGGFPKVDHGSWRPSDICGVLLVAGTYPLDHKNYWMIINSKSECSSTLKTKENVQGINFR